MSLNLPPLPKPPLSWLADAESNSAFRNLVALLRERGGICVIGSGLSVPAGYPTWGALYEEIRQGMPEPSAYLCLSRVEQDRTEMVLTLLRLLSRMEEDDESAVLRTLQRRFAPTPPPTPPTYSTLYEMKAMRAIVTVNYDHLLASCSRLIDEISAYPRFKTNRRLRYVHGYIVEALSVADFVLSETSYHAAYLVNAAPVANQLHELLGATETAVFVGFGTSDPFMNHVLVEMRANRRTRDLGSSGKALSASDPPSFIIEREGADPDRRRAFLDALGLTPIYYRSSEGADRHAYLPEILRALARETRLGEDLP